VADLALEVLAGDTVSVTSSSGNSTVELITDDVAVITSATDGPDMEIELTLDSPSIEVTLGEVGNLLTASGSLDIQVEVSGVYSTADLPEIEIVEIETAQRGVSGPPLRADVTPPLNPIIGDLWFAKSVKPIMISSSFTVSDQPVSMIGTGMWIQTGLGDTATDFTFWIEDGR